MIEESLDERRAEFEAHLWDHAEDAFQQEFDLRRPLDDAELAALSEIADALAEGADDEEIAVIVRDAGRGSESVFLTVMQLVGLTRNKIITDLKASAAARGTRIPSTPGQLPRSDAWRFAGPYIAQRLRRVIGPLAVDGEVPSSAFEALNQATYPGWIRQQRAKLSGHEAEYRLAVLLDECGLPFEPQEKKDNPLCRDATLYGVSFDVVVPSVREPRMCVKATVHTSNIGQFGESKDALEMSEAAAMLDEHFRGSDRPRLLALIDGVGFRSNSAGLNGVLTTADEFCQFQSIWKGAAVAAFSLERSLTVALPERHISAHASFFERHEDFITPVPLTERFRSQGGLVEAGEAVLKVG